MSVTDATSLEAVLSLNLSMVLLLLRKSMNCVVLSPVAELTLQKKKFCVLIISSVLLSKRGSPSIISALLTEILLCTAKNLFTITLTTAFFLLEISISLGKSDIVLERNLPSILRLIDLVGLVVLMKIFQTL